MRARAFVVLRAPRLVYKHGVMNAAFWITHLRLEPHPEGGHFREAYRASEEIEARHLPSRFAGRRSFSTAIYFLLRGGEFSALHRIKADEVWHFYAGETLQIACLHPDGRLDTFRLGPQPEFGDTFQAVAPAGCWFGARLLSQAAFALVGCTVAPGFDYRDFELASRPVLLKEFPQHRELIEALTHP